MKRNPILEMLYLYQNTWADGYEHYVSFSQREENDCVEKFLKFIKEEPNCFERSCPTGHVTASAMVTNIGCDKVLLTLHGKLNKWLQLGGHTDGDHDVAASAIREAQEESGRPEVTFYPYESIFKNLHIQTPLIFDLDCHLIPGRTNEPEHYHFDVRFLCLLDDSLPLLISDESHELAWHPVHLARELNKERSMERQFVKLDMIRQLLVKSRL